MRLTDRTVTNTNPALLAGKNEAIIFDEDIPGFGLRLRKAGARTGSINIGWASAPGA